MHTFTDMTGRAWSLVINPATAKRCKSLTGVDVLGLLTRRMAPLDALLADKIKLCEVLFALLLDQAQAAGVDEFAFLSCLAGDPLERAAEVFQEELVDFFPERERALYRDLLKKGRKIGDRAYARDRAALDRLDPETVDLDELVRQLERREAARETTTSPATIVSTPPASGAGSGSSPASSASIPTP